MASPTTVLEIRDLDVCTLANRVSVLRGIRLAVGEGELHAVVGGAVVGGAVVGGAVVGARESGPSTLASSLLGHPGFEVTSGSILFRGDDVTWWPPDVRAKVGMFLAAPQRAAFPGVSLVGLLRQAMAVRTDDESGIIDLQLGLTEWVDRLGFDPSIIEGTVDDLPANRWIHTEILQMAMLEPDVVVIDMTALDLGSDELRLTADAIAAVRRHRPTMGVLVTTDNDALLRLLAPDGVHHLVDGAMVDGALPRGRTTRGPRHENPRR